ncbi:putative cytokinetic ring protein SteA [Brevibacterium sp. JSBI002]|uniref:putative cytokinetic ring protein SteA n=1 Tax=Brevibacterium sp. JSBI002 TaxID=2886045 RepID=UPI002230A092|nr:putative cytokinetic ring protein SteA [Brevibacterium sp. JSBI002]UZD61081.1 putative cytokinetic ring protein SteA [Brevibacterium sp. JSBI002]
MKVRRQNLTAPTRFGPAPARLDRRTKNLTKRLQAGDIAVIKHSDIDRISAEALVACRPAAVINADKSISGRYPNLGPSIIVDAGIPLIDAAGADIFDAVDENAEISIEGATVFAGETEVATGVRQTAETISEDMHAAEAGMNSVLVDFIDNTIEYIRKDSDLLSAELVVPEVKTTFTDRHVLIVVRGYHYKEDLAMLASYIREYRPLLIGVDGGADAIIEAGYRPDMIVGDMDSVSDTALTSGAEIVVHAYRDGTAPGTERVEALGVECVAFAASGTSEDIAMLLADDKGAELIVAVGTHDTVMEFLDKGRKGMASTFITRLRVGSKLIDAKGVSLLYRQRISSLQLAVLIIAGLVALGVAMTATSAGQTFLGLIGAQLDGLFGWIGSLFGGDPAASTDSAGLIQGLTSD